MVLRVVWLVALRPDGMVLQKVSPEPPPWPVGVLVVAPMGWCWGGVPKSCPRIPTARWGGVLKVGVVLQKVVPESPRLDCVVFQKLGWCSKRLSQNPHGSMGWCSKSWCGVPKKLSQNPHSVYYLLSLFYF